MKNLIIFSMLAVMVVINFTGCGKAQERPANPNKKIASQIVAISGLADVTTDENQNSEQNIAFKKKLISKIESKDFQGYLENVLAENRLAYLILDKKIILMEYVPADKNKHISSAIKVESVSGATEANQGLPLYSRQSLIDFKSGHIPQTAKATAALEEGFLMLADIEIQVGILENEKTDYNEKKSTLNLTETSLDQAQYLILKSEIKANYSSK